MCSIRKEDLFDFFGLDNKYGLTGEMEVDDRNIKSSLSTLIAPPVDKKYVLGVRSYTDDKKNLLATHFILGELQSDTAMIVTKEKYYYTGKYDHLVRPVYCLGDYIDFVDISGPSIFLENWRENIQHNVRVSDFATIKYFTKDELTVYPNLFIREEDELER